MFPSSPKSLEQIANEVLAVKTNAKLREQAKAQENEAKKSKIGSLIGDLLANKLQCDAVQHDSGASVVSPSRQP